MGCGRDCVEKFIQRVRQLLTGRDENVVRLEERRRKEINDKCIRDYKKVLRNIDSAMNDLMDVTKGERRG